MDGSDLWMIVPLVKGGSLESLLQRGHQKVGSASIPSLCQCITCTAQWTWGEEWILLHPSTVRVLCQAMP